MKVSMLGLALSTVAFGASTIYLWQQLEDERAKTAEVLAASKELNARIVELEKARTELAQRRFGVPGTFEGGLVAPGPEKAPPHEPDEAGKATVATGTFASSQRPPEMPPAMIKMMRAQMRQQNKRTYFDL